MQGQHTHSHTHGGEEEGSSCIGRGKHRHTLGEEEGEEEEEEEERPEGGGITSSYRTVSTGVHGNVERRPDVGQKNAVAGNLLNVADVRTWTGFTGMW
ncbi:uncharacterized protein V6R79_001345 [Siganus canaliculatus]